MRDHDRAVQDRVRARGFPVPHRPIRTLADLENSTSAWVAWLGEGGIPGGVSAILRGGAGMLWGGGCGVRAVPGSPGRCWRCSSAGASAARRLPGDGRRAGAPEYGAGHGVRPEGVLHRGRQGAGRVVAADVLSSSPPSANRDVVRRWCGSRTVRRGCRRARSSDGCLGVRAVRVPARARGVTTRTRCRKGCRPAPSGTARGVPLIRTPRTLPRVILTRTGGCPDGGAAHPSGPGDGAGDAAGRAAPLRGARAAAGRCAAGRSAVVHRRRQGRASADRAGVTAVLRHFGRLPGPGAARTRPRRIACSWCSRANVGAGR